MKAIKKFLALLLAAVMAFTVVPVFAAQSSSVPEKALSAGRLYGCIWLSSCLTPSFPSGFTAPLRVKGHPGLF